MKKLLLGLSIAFLLTATLSSCCKTCAKTGENSVQVCRNNYNTEQDYTNAVSVFEFLGYTCN
jgi:ABC-type oligopeptide transport system substrate-binding subunit